MYLLIFFLVPVLYLFNPRLALAGLIMAIAVAYFQRTRSTARRGPRRMMDSSPYKAGYED